MITMNNLFGITKKILTEGKWKGLYIKVSTDKKGNDELLIHDKNYQNMIRMSISPLYLRNPETYVQENHLMLEFDNNGWNLSRCVVNLDVYRTMDRIIMIFNQFIYDNLDDILRSVYLMESLDKNGKPMDDGEA